MVEYQSADHEQQMKILRPAPFVEEVIPIIICLGYHQIGFLYASNLSDSSLMFIFFILGFLSFSSTSLLVAG
jgi:hypothetical protein